MIVRCKCLLAPGPLAGSGGAAPSGTFLKAPVMTPPCGAGQVIHPAFGRAKRTQGKAGEGHKQALYGRMSA